MASTTGDVDNDTHRLDGVRLGAVSKPGSYTSGTYCLDAFASRRAGPLGTLAGAHGCTVWAETEDDGSYSLEDDLAAALPLTDTETVEMVVTEVVSDTLLLEAESQALGAEIEETLAATGEQWSHEVVITYSYDPLFRLTEANYNNGRSFTYKYDSVGNTTSQVDSTRAGTITTTYAFDTANQLQSASSGGLAWRYSYDLNGSLVEVTPKGSLNGGRRYSYTQAGYLAQVESHDGASYQLQAEMEYNGLGQRLAMTAYALGQSVTTQYTLDTAWSGYPLVADADGQSTYYLYGRGPIAEKTTAWSYYLKDGQGTARQLADPSGLVTLARTFTPWGETLEQHGEGDLAWGYFGGYMDAATGLLYVGNGQYYDPATGRFLTRQPGRINPYVPWSDPLGASVGILGLLGMLRRRKRKGKLSRLDMLALLLAVLAGGASLAACGGGSGPVGPSLTPPSQPPGDTPTPEPSPSQPGESPVPPSTADDPWLPTGTCTPSVRPGSSTPPANLIPTPDPTPARTVVILACGMGVPLGACRNQDSVDGYNEGWLTPDEAPLNPYYNWAIGIGYSVSWYEFEDYGAKYAMAQTMAGEMEASNDIYILVGHSAGADAVILAADMVRYKDIDSIAVLDPTLTATIPPSQTGTSILDMANQVAANLPVFLGDTPSDGNITITGAGRYPYDYSHLGLAVADDVFMDAHNYLKWK